MLLLRVESFNLAVWTEDFLRTIEQVLLFVPLACLCLRHQEVITKRYGTMSMRRPIVSHCLYLFVSSEDYKQLPLARDDGSMCPLVDVQLPAEQQADILQ